MGFVRNPIGWRDRLARLRGVPVEVDLRSYDADVAAINGLEPDVRRLSDDGLAARFERAARSRPRRDAP